MPTEDEIRILLLNAVREVMRERPAIGVMTAMEWAVSGRLGIQLARDPVVTGWEREGVRVDIEYAQAGRLGGYKRTGRVIGGAPMRPDLVVHQRGRNRKNWLAVEMKMHGRVPTEVDPDDLSKLKSYARECRYKVAIWLSLPRSLGRRNARAYYAVIGRDQVSAPTVLPVN